MVYPLDGSGGHLHPAMTVLGMTLNCLGRAVRYPLATGHPSGWPGSFSKVVQGAQPLVFPFLFPFALPAPWAFPRPLVPAGLAFWMEVVDAMEELSRRIHSHYVIHGWMVAAAGTRRRPKPRSRICPSASALSPRAACSCQSHSQEKGNTRSGTTASGFFKP